MGYLAEGFAWGFRPSFLRATRSFDQNLGANGGNMQGACRDFLRYLDYEVEIHRPWNLNSGSILFVSDHHSALDGFAIPLLCPSSLTIRRVVFHLSALMIGKEFTRHSILIWPRGSYRNLIFEARGFVDRVAYLITHRWGPWVQSGRALARMQATLQAGESLMLLPSGTIGDLHWRRGLGALIQSVPDNQPCYLAPVYLNWDFEQRRVKLDAPQLIEFSKLRNQFGPDPDCQALSDWLANKYRLRDWSEFEIPNSNSTRLGL